jgi:capsular polysaccharide transport system permease protein
MLHDLIRKPLFIWLFLVPNLLSIIYFGFWATPIYTSSASMLVTVPKKESSSIAGMLSGGASDGSQEGAYILKEHIDSWSVFQAVNKSSNLADSYSVGDLVGRYGGLASFFQKSDVALWHYYQSMVNIKVDEKSGIVSLSVYGYRPDFSTNLATNLLQDAVRHMDRMNVQQDHDFVGLARSRRQSLEHALANDEAGLAAYRTKIGVYDPEQRNLSDLSLVDSLSIQEAQLKSQLVSANATIPDNPAAKGLASSLSSVEAKLKQAQDAVPALARNAAEYSDLTTQRENDVALLNQASLSLQSTELKATVSRYYLNIISQPSEPMTPQKPDRLKWIGIVLLVTFLLWGLLR